MVPSRQRLLIVIRRLVIPLLVVASAITLTACGGLKAVAPTQDLQAPKPKLANFLTPTERVLSVRQVQLEAGGSAEVAVIAVDPPDQSLGGFVPQRLIILAWDTYAKRWTNVFDTDTASQQVVGYEADAPDTSFDESVVPTPTTTTPGSSQYDKVTDIHITPIADQSGGAVDLLYMAIPYSGSGAGTGGIIHFADQSATFVWGYGSPDPYTMKAIGIAPDQEALVNAVWDSAADAHCCDVRNFNLTLKVVNPKNDPGSEYYKVVNDNRPWHGAWIYPVSESSANEAIGFGPGEIISITPGSPASKVLKVGDILESVVGAKPLNGRGSNGPGIVDELAEQLAGKSVMIKLLRGGVTMSVRVKLGSRDASQAVQAQAPSPGDFDVQAETMTPALSSSDSLPNAAGVLIDSVISGGPADNAGLQEGDIITSVDGYPIKSDTDLIIADAIVGQGSTVSVNFVNPQGVSQSTQITLGIPSSNNNYESFDYL